MFGELSNGPYVFGLEHVPLPAVACDHKANICWVNKRFKSLINDSSKLTGSLFDLIVSSDETLPLNNWDEVRSLFEAGISTDVKIGDNLYTMHAGPAGEMYGCVFSPIRSSFDLNADNHLLGTRISTPPLKTPAGTDLLDAFIFLARKLNLTMREEKLIGLFVKMFERLFPGRLFCVQIADTDTLEIKQVYANGRLREDARNSLHLTEAARDEYELDSEQAVTLLNRANFKITQNYEPIFENGRVGFDIPLFDGTAFYGVIKFEYADPAGPGTADMPFVAPLAHLMSSSIRNARLLARTVVLKDYLEKILDRANAPMLVVDKNRMIKVVNQSFERLSGYSRDDILGIDVMSLVPEAEHSHLLPAIISSLRGDLASNIELRIPRADGKSFAHLAFSTASILSPFGQLESLIFIGQDLTELHALQNQIIHSEKLATLGQIAAGVAHELNNPLTSISVYANYLLRKLDDVVSPQDLEKIDRIKDSADRIQGFTRDLVTYARPSGEEPTLIDPGELVERSMSFCEHIITESYADVVLTIADDLKPIYGIRGQLEQVLVNLITNACHALPENGGKIKIDLVSIDEDQMEIRIADTGHGISGQHLEEIFEPFFTTKPEGQGTGLGLSIVRNIIVNHDAQIEVSSDPGKGTTFIIRMFSG